MIDQSGLDKPFTSGVTDFDDYFNSPPTAFAQAAAGNNWQSQTFFTLPVTGFVDFDFGAVYSIDRLAVWNISMKDIRILASGTSIDTLQEVASFALPNHLNFPFSYRHDLLSLGSAQDVRFVRIQIDSVHLFSPSQTFGFAIVGEVAASAVPVSDGIDGDYNADGSVDAADYSLWRKHVGTNFQLPNDTTPLDVGPDDYGVWRANFDAIVGNSARVASVPEPSANLLLVLAGWALLAVRHRQTIGITAPLPEKIKTKCRSSMAR
jgi:hypothetical protein